MFFSRERKWDLMNWQITLYTAIPNDTYSSPRSRYSKSQKTMQCSGILLAPTWILTPSHCWKNYQGDELVFGQGTFDKSQREPETIHIRNIVYYPGPLDIAMIHISYGSETLSEVHAFPCVLSLEGQETTKIIGTTGILQTAIKNKSPRSTKVRYRGLPMKVQKGSQFCSHKKYTCVETNSFKDFSETKLSVQDAPFFVKVGRTRWALSAMGVTSKYNVVKLTNLSQTIDWLDGLIFQK